MNTPYSRISIVPRLPRVLHPGLLLLLLLLAVACPRPATAHTTETVESLTLTNFTGWLVSSDVANANSGYDRDALRVHAALRYTTTNAGPSTFQYQTAFRLLDAQSNAVPLLTGFLQTNTTVYVTNSVTLPSPFVPGITSAVAAVTAGLKPASPLSPYKAYRVEARLAERPAGSTNDFSFTGDLAQTASTSIYHFTNLLSGDVARNVIASLNNVVAQRAYAVKTVPSRRSFQVQATYALRRYDDFNLAPANTPVDVVFLCQLYNTNTGQLVPLKFPTQTLTKSVPTYVLGTIKSPGTTAFTDTLDLEPDDAVQLDSVNHTFVPLVTISHVDVPGQSVTPGNIRAAAGTRLLHFNGDLLFGTIRTRFTSLANDPLPQSFPPNAVGTTLAVDGQSGYVLASPAHTYGDGTALPVELRTDGTARYVGASPVAVTGPNPDTNTANGIRFQRVNLVLNNGGGTATFATWYPTGFGTRSSAGAVNHLLAPYAVFANLALNDALLPTVSPVNVATAWGCEETKPYLFRFNAQTWDIPNGRFVFTPTGEIRYTRAEELAALEAAPVAAAFKRKPSNERALASVAQVTSAQIIVAADPQVHSARMTMDLMVGPNGFLAHFPHEAAITNNATTLVSISDDLITTGPSQLQGVAPVTVAYTRDCTEPDCAGGQGSDSLPFAAQDATLHFTRDGGLTAKGAIVQPKDLTWGWIPSKGRYAHRVQAFSPAGFHMPGFFLRGGESLQQMEQRAAVLLFTGVGTNTSVQLDFTRIERPNGPLYANGTNGGFGDYAGLNFRVGQDGDRQADSTLAAEPTGFYPLTGRSKYYVRKGGLSGIHEAVLGSFPKTNRWYGYAFQVNNFGLAFRDSQNVDSRTEGSVYVQDPSDITQNFEKLVFNCLGGLDYAQVPATENGTYKELRYWKADISALAIDFQRKQAGQCDPGEGKLVLGVKAHPAPFPGVAMFGQLGFETNGNFITLNDHVLDPPFDSRLKLPNNLTFAGPAGEQWHFTPVNDAYFNNYQHRGPGEGNGWLNIAGKLDAPFFEDLRVQLQCGADRENPNAPVYVAGGWEIPGQGYEWLPGRHFFNENPSDQDNVGWPRGVANSVAQYRNGNAQTERWLVRARRLWLDVVPFDYPLAWDEPTRSFRSAKDVHNDVMVLNVEHKLNYLSPQIADLAFGAQYDGIPQLNLANLGYSQLGGLRDAVEGVVGPELDQGMSRLAQTLSAHADQLFDPAFESMLRPRVEAMVHALHLDYNAGAWADVSEAVAIMGGYVTNGATSLAGRLKNLANDPSANDLAKSVQQNLAAVVLALNRVEAMLTEDAPGRRTLVRQILQGIVGQAAPQFLDAIASDRVNEMLQQVDPTFDQLLAVTQSLRQAVESARTQLGFGGPFQQELASILTSQAGALGSVALQAQGDFTSILQTFHFGAQDSPFAHYTEPQLSTLFLQKLKDRFFGSIVASKLRETIKHRLYDLDASIRQTVDSVFQQVNVVVRDVLSETAQQLDNSIAPMLGDLKSVCGAGKLNGYAHINGDSLKELRVDVYASLKVPSDMEFHGFLLVRELDSENYPTECLPAGGKATEVTLGADKIPVKFASCDAKVSTTAKFTFDGSTAALLGVAGGIDLEGRITLGPATIKKLSAALAFGVEENYFSAACLVSVNSYTGMGGLYFGRTCTLDPLRWDPEIQKIIGQPPFTGAYTYVEVWIPVSEALLGIPATCMFQVSAGMGMGAGFFVEGPTFLGKAMLGVSGDFLCVASISGDIKLAGKGSPQGINMLGSGTFEVEICALVCISASKTVEIQYKNGSWDIDF